jgi:hypothetical protein
MAKKDPILNYLPSVVDVPVKSKDTVNTSNKFVKDIIGTSPEAVRIVLSVKNKDKKGNDFKKSIVKWVVPIDKQKSKFGSKLNKAQLVLTYLFSNSFCSNFRRVNNKARNFISEEFS